MAETKTIEGAPQQVRDMFNRGFGALERGNLDYAIDMFLACIDIDPALSDVRRFLRAAEIKKARQRKSGMFSRLGSTVKGTPLLTRVSVLLRSGKPLEAVKVAERLLKEDLFNLKFMTTFAKAAEAADLPEAAIQILALARDSHPGNAGLLSHLGKLHEQSGQISEARTCYEEVVNLRPNDGDALRALKNSMATESMSKDGWTAAASSKEGFRMVLKDTEEAEMLEKEAKAVRSSKDTRSLIEEALAKIEQEPTNINYYRTLANMYASEKMFDEAAAILQRAQEMRSGSDPEVDATLSSIMLQKHDAEIERFLEAGDEAGAEARRQERIEFVFASLQDRVRKYPNDLHLRYELGRALLDRDMITEAIQQFQLSQRNPQHRIKSFYFLGMCFRQKQQYDMAAEQLEQAAKESLVMDNTKKDIIYELGLIQEALNNPAAAREYYKQIYQVDIGYRDVARKVEQLPSR